MKSNSSESAVALTELLNDYMCRCFPERTRKAKKSDAPWFNSKTRAAVDKKMRIYKREGKSDNYKQASKDCEREIADAKKVFLDKVIEKCKAVKNTRGYYKYVKMLSSKESPVIWEIFSLFPGMDAGEIAEAVAEFFNEISQEYPSLPDPSRPWDDTTPNIIEEYEIAARLRRFKKPKSTVYGDIRPELVTDFADLLAPPLCFIFNQTLHTLSWPSIWKAETVHVIPKNAAPSGLSELRNLSCTPLYSKVLESFVLDKLKKEVKLSSRQYGGIKGSSPEHFLVDTWNEVIGNLDEKNAASNLISVDFSKAFNRMHHYRCLESLVDLGAEITTVDWVACFLYGRTMSVKVENSYSVPRPAPGGSPQGSILGNFLFCATTNCFTELNGERSVNGHPLWSSSSSSSGSSAQEEEPRADDGPTATSTPGVSILGASAASDNNDIDSSSVEDGDLVFFRTKRVNLLSSTTEDEEEDDLSADVVRLERETNKEMETFVYIDDFNAIERIELVNAPSHITTKKTVIEAQPAKSERLFGRIGNLAQEIGMQVNNTKTQMLCIHPCVHNDAICHINTADGKISSTDELKLLGFTFNSHPNANRHVELLIERFHSKLWTLRFLKRSGLDEERLLGVYNSAIRSTVEYCSVVYHSMIPGYLAEELESIQRRALRIIYGWDTDVRTLMEVKGIEELKQRRENAVLKFALKNEHVGKFGGKWFRKKEERTQGASTRGANPAKYEIPFCRNERKKSNPVIYMATKLNEHYSGMH